MMMLRLMWKWKLFKELLRCCSRIKISSETQNEPLKSTANIKQNIYSLVLILVLVLLVPSV